MPSFELTPQNEIPQEIATKLEDLEAKTNAAEILNSSIAHVYFTAGQIRSIIGTKFSSEDLSDFPNLKSILEEI
jgi:hypothetical protein